MTLLFKLRFRTSAHSQYARKDICIYSIGIQSVTFVIKLVTNDYCRLKYEIHIKYIHCVVTYQKERENCNNTCTDQYLTRNQCTVNSCLIDLFLFFLQDGAIGAIGPRATYRATPGCSTDTDDV